MTNGERSVPLRSRATVVLAMVVGLVLLLAWAWDGHSVPAFGPPTVECDRVSPAVCERAWRSLAEEYGIHSPTRVTIQGSGACASYIEIRYGLFPWNAVVAQALC